MSAKKVHLTLSMAQAHALLALSEYGQIAESFGDVDVTGSAPASAAGERAIDKLREAINR